VPPAADLGRDAHPADGQEPQHARHDLVKREGPGTRASRRTARHIAKTTALKIAALARAAIWVAATGRTARPRFESAEAPDMMEASTAVSSPGDPMDVGEAPQNGEVALTSAITTKKDGKKACDLYFTVFDGLLFECRLDKLAGPDILTLTQISKNHGHWKKNCAEVYLREKGEKCALLVFKGSEVTFVWRANHLRTTYTLPLRRMAKALDALLTLVLEQEHLLVPAV
jgi:hypothetical protein